MTLELYAPTGQGHRHIIVDVPDADEAGSPDFKSDVRSAALHVIRETHASQEYRNVIRMQDFITQLITGSYA